MWFDFRSALNKLVVLLTIDAVLFVSFTSPVAAFQISSATGYARYASQAAQAAYVAANRAQIIQAVAPMVTSASVGSIAVRAVAGAIGWSALGVGALVIAAALYSSMDRTTIKNNAATYYGLPSTIMVNGQAAPAGSHLTDNCAGGSIPCSQTMFVPNGLDISVCAGQYPPMSLYPPAGWTAQPVQWMAWTPEGACYNTFTLTNYGGSGQYLATNQAATPSSDQVAGYLTSLPASDPLAPESHVQPGGTTNPAPSGTAGNTDLPVSPVQLPTVVGPANAIPGGSAVVDPNAPAPQQTTQQKTQDATTATTTNADGSKTDTQTASVQCNAGAHNQQSFGQVLQDHVNVWQASGLMGTLNLIKNITWPTSFPTYTLTSTMFGTLTFDFNAWSGVINGLRGLIIAGAGFVAYRIIFVGGGA